MAEAAEDLNVTEGAEQHPDDETENTDFGNDFVEDEAPAPKRTAIDDDESEPEPEPESEPEPAEASPVAEAEELEDDEEEAPPKKERSRMIPRDRFDEVNEERKRLRDELERRNQAQQQAAQARQQAQQNRFDFDKKEREYMEAALDGDAEKALAIRRQIRAAEAQAYRREADTLAARRAQAVQQEAINRDVIAEANRRYPMFDPDSDQFDATLTNEAVAFINGYQQGPQQLDFPTAVARTLTVMSNLYGLQDVTAPVEEEQSAPAAAPSVKATQKKIDKVSQQPPRQNKGKGTPQKELETSIFDLSDEEFDALPAATRARLRGDVM